MLFTGVVGVSLALICPEGRARVGDNCYPEACVFDGTVCAGNGNCYSVGCECDEGFLLSEHGCQRMKCVDRKTKYYCGRHGECSKAPPFKCQCEDGYKSVGNSCIPPLCMENGTVCGGVGSCEYDGNKPYCKCSRQYTGDQCEQCASDSTRVGSKCVLKNCVSNVTGEPTTCGGHGLCIASMKNNTGACICFPGAKKIEGGCVPSACVSESHGERGICSGRGACKKQKCACDAGYEGAQCQYVTQRCESGFISKNGECVSESCITDSGDVCDGHGRCVGDHCVCDEGFALLGEASCTPLSCIVSGDVCPNGACKKSDGAWGCTCNKHYVLYDGYCVPQTCITGYVSGSIPIICSGHGVCDRQAGTCQCNYNYEGKHCQMCSKTAILMGNGECVPMSCVLQLRDGSMEVCSNHGTCKTIYPHGNNYVDYCECDSGYTMIEPSICAPDSCMNPRTLTVQCTAHGHCEDGKCICDAGYSGTYCEEYACPEGELYTSKGCYPAECVTAYDDGERRVCSGNGKCVKDRRTFKCVCNGNSEMIDGVCVATSCITNPDRNTICSGNGVCRDNICTCDHGFVGGFCERKL